MKNIITTLMIILVFAIAYFNIYLIKRNSEVDKDLEQAQTELKKKTETIELLIDSIDERKEKTDKNKDVVPNNKKQKASTHYEVCARFTKHFIDKYRYENSKNYFFALRIADKYGETIGYYDVFRNVFGGVSNDKRYGLTGAISASEFVDRVCRYIPLGETISISGKQGEEYAYKYYKMDLGKEYTFELSSTKELRGRDLSEMTVQKVVR